jgi:transcription initiation factor TFIIIB Brf1 subunit/transcription initiation factor TFIIB
MAPEMPVSSNDEKKCQNCHHGELQHDVVDGAYYRCRACGTLCSGKYYQIEPDE